MNSRLEELIGEFVQNIRLLSSFEAVHFELMVGTYEHQANWVYHTADDLKSQGISMKNLNGKWIKEDKEE